MPGRAMIAAAVSRFLAPVLGLALVAALALAGWQWSEATVARAELADAKADFSQREATAAKEYAGQIQRALTDTISMQRKADEAIRKAQERAAQLAAATDRARAESRGLRDDLAAAEVRLSRAPVEAVREYASAANAVLDDCRGAYQGMAEAAAGHEGDVRTLIDAWPSKETKP